MKLCGKCKTSKPLDAFVKDKGSRDGLTARCKDCRSQDFKLWYKQNPDVVKRLRTESQERHKEYYQSPERKKKYRIRYIESTFGIPYSQYEAMHNAQNGLCAICNKPETSSKCKYLSVDHCHKTGIIRGLLCVSCNRGLGMFWDDANILSRAIQYINAK